MELLTGLIFLAVYAAFLSNGNGDFVTADMFPFMPLNRLIVFAYALVVSSVFIVISVYDIRHTVIPNGLVYSLSVLAFARLYDGWSFDMPALFAGIVFFSLFWMFWFFSRGRAMGLGDAKLSLAIGWLLGPAQGIVALFVAVWSGALVGLLLIIASKTRALFLRGKYFTLKSEIPFGPFLAFGALIAFVFRLDIDTLTSLFSFYV